MGKTILFSPVGGTDPIHMRNMSDGSMLHICRYYQPDEVILYMSKEIIAYHEADDRYQKAIHKLGELQNKSYEIKTIMRPELENVQDFDFFYKEFREILRDILSTMNNEDELLINISSGTPAMKSGLLVLVTLGEIPCKTIQVSTPEKAMNEHEHKGFDLEILWDLNPDNSNCENRCVEVKCPVLTNMHREEIIKKHILAYDYEAALSVAEEMPKEATTKYIKLLRIARSRSVLNLNDIGKYTPHNEEGIFPVWSTDGRKIFEYALIVDLRRKKGEYADFLRAFTPLFAELLKRILEYKCNFKLDNYIFYSKTLTPKWDEDKMPKDIYEYLCNEFSGKFSGGVVFSTHLVKIIEYLCDNSELVLKIKSLREVEEKIRNVAAHQITAITDEMIRQKTGFNANQVMNLIKEVFPATGVSVNKDSWKSYDLMNQMIIKAM